MRARTSIPAPVTHAVRRPTVEKLLHESPQHRLTLISAGPGWGKTTATALWAGAEPGVKVAWFTCEAQDDEPAAFWTGVVAALRAAGAVPDGHPLAALRIPTQVPPNLLRRLLGAIESLPEPVVLVLDEFHVLESADVLGFVEDVLRYPLPLHLAILTRADPVLGLHRLRAQGGIVEVVADDLAFDAPAVTALAAREGLTIDPAEVTRVLAETGGWAVGVRLRLSPPKARAGNASVERSMAEYLVTEVLDGLDTPMRRFLLRTSIVNSVCAELAAALDPGAPAERFLAELGTRNRFVTSSGPHGTWYRFHPLLREMLRSRLRLEDPDTALAAHRTAARWFARNDEPVQALQHAAACGDWGLLGEIFVDVAAACLVLPTRRAVADALARVPFADLTMDATMHLCAGSLALLTERFGAARAHANRARELLDAPIERPVASALVELLEAETAQAEGNVRQLATAGGAALAALDQVPFPFPGLEAYLSLATSYRTAGLLWCGVESDTVPSRHDDGVIDIFGARAVAALAHVAAGYLPHGEAEATSILDAAATRGWTTQVQMRPAYAALAWCRLLRAEDQEAERLLSLALAADAGGRQPASELAVRLLQAHVSATRRHLRAAKWSLAAADRALAPEATPTPLVDLRARVAAEVALLSEEPSPSPTNLAPPSPAVAATCRARRLLRVGRLDAALHALEAIDPVDPRLDALTRAEAALVEASAHAATGTRRVDEAVARALDIAAPHRLALPFLTVPTPELAVAVARATGHRDDPLAHVLRSRLGHSTAPEQAQPVEPLTERELEILGALPSMESNTEIAEDFFVTVNTVKTHLKSLYRKLGVSSRREAVRRGRALGLLPQ